MKFVLFFVACFMAYHGAEAGTQLDVCAALIVEIQPSCDKLAAVPIGVVALQALLNLAPAQGANATCILAVQNQLNSLTAYATDISSALLTFQNCKNQVNACAASPLGGLTCLLSGVVTALQALLAVVLGLLTGCPSALDKLTLLTAQLQACLPAVPLPV